jgi:hypothetical protein
LIGNPLSPHIKCTDGLNDDLFQKFRQSRHPSFPTWLKQNLGFNTVAANEKPDLANLHRSGWVQLNDNGEVTNVIWRNMNSRYRCVIGEVSQFLLKPGRVGWEVDPYQQDDIAVASGYVSSARFCDIDLAAMRQTHVTAAPNNWDRARHITADRKWMKLKAIYEMHQDSTPLNPGSDSWEECYRASQEWRAQPVIRQLLEDENLSNLHPSLLDAMMLARDDFVQYCVEHAPVLGTFDVLWKHRFLLWIDELDLLAGLEDDTKLTCVTVKH